MQQTCSPFVQLLSACPAPLGGQPVQIRQYPRSTSLSVVLCASSVTGGAGPLARHTVLPCGNQGAAWLDVSAAVGRSSRHVAAAADVGSDASDEVRLDSLSVCASARSAVLSRKGGLIANGLAPVTSHIVNRTDHQHLLSNTKLRFGRSCVQHALHLTICPIMTRHMCRYGHSVIGSCGWIHLVLHRQDPPQWSLGSWTRCTWRGRRLAGSRCSLRGA